MNAGLNHNCYTKFISDLFSECWQFSGAAHYGYIASLEIFDPKEFFTAQPPLKTKQGRFFDVDINQTGDRAVLNIAGGLYKKPGAMAKAFFGLADLNEINQDLETLTADQKIRHVILNIDSPGGLARASSETAERVAELAAKKDRVIAYTDGVLGSAAYKLAAPAHEIHASKDASVGSIGTYLALADDSKRWEKAGVELKLFRDGPLKALGHPGKAMTEEESAHLQDEVQALSKKFKDFVRANRPDIKEYALQGQTLSGKRAINAGLIDGHHRDLASLVAAEITRF